MGVRCLSLWIDNRLLNRCDEGVKATVKSQSDEGLGDTPQDAFQGWLAYFTFYHGRVFVRPPLEYLEGNKDTMKDLDFGYFTYGMLRGSCVDESYGGKILQKVYVLLQSNEDGWTSGCSKSVLGHKEAVRDKWFHLANIDNEEDVDPANADHANANHANADHANADHANADHANANHANVQEPGEMEQHVHMEEPVQEADVQQPGEMEQPVHMEEPV
ncbi:hypothetical protein Tco_0123877 [Tanacetum coccineum]